MALTKFSPIRYFFRTSQNIPSITHARAIAKEFNKLGDLVEYKFIRCPETHAYLNYGFVTFKNKEHTTKAISETGGFLKMGAPFEQPVDIKFEKSTMRTASK
ncbi:hypothetical protein INT43_007465 [Umbelopsis isabellina]|uniref:RRM domain-containing protein n=1 Tax=Mortierella isabellina TaxID=91625 RepID=A0A8H7PXN5_MORIS|nr:hypothetical protein INT43_007465 [Umbelopsis isabellina]